MFQMPDILLLLLRKGLTKCHWLAQNLLCRLGWPYTCSDPPAPGSCMLELQEHATMPG